ncbi:cation-translocating P-type ATPase [Streptomyces milbemycinicus]|uniref:cation-translocating P-type ATPase n=1 Tax=Streptomyces milbemycinicus TaxID=476552 RepID=UPI003F4D567D
MNRRRGSRRPGEDVEELRSTTPAEEDLSPEEAARRLELCGPNEVQVEPRTPVWRRGLQQPRDPLILVLLVAAALTIATGDLSDAAVILLVITVNTVVGVVQEVRAEAAVMALSAMSAPAARVVRDGAERSVPAAEVVPGDLVLVAEGDIVPADGDVLAAALLLADESSLTGESVPVEKAPDGESSRGTVSAGTVIVRGRGRVQVTATGADSALGRIASLMGTAPGLTPLQRRLARFGRVLAAVTVALCAVVLALGLVRGQSAGTLTEGRMAAERLWTPRGEATVVGTGYVPEGRVVRDGATVTAGDVPELAALLRVAMVCNDAALEPPSDSSTEWRALGDPTEAALPGTGARLGLDRAALDRELPRVEEIPFDSGRKRMTTVHRRPEGGLRVACKGAPEKLLGPRILADGPDAIARAAAQAEALARGGYRVLAVASADHEETADRPPTWESGLSLLGLVGILDPPRSASQTTMAACKRAGIVPVLITGDHPLTARAVAERLGIASREEEVTTGERIREGTAGDLTGVRVCARTTPEQKLDIVQAWRGAVARSVADAAMRSARISPEGRRPLSKKGRPPSYRSQREA